MGKKKKKLKNGGTIFGGKMKSHLQSENKSHLSHIGRIKEVVVLILGNTSFTS